MAVRQNINDRFIYFVTSEVGGPPLSHDQISKLQSAVDSIMTGVHIEVMNALEFMTQPSVVGGVVWPYFRGLPCPDEDVLALLDGKDEFMTINDYRNCPYGLDNKWVNYEYAKNDGIPIPQSFSITNPEELKNLPLEFPMVLKGYPSGRGEDVHLCETLEEAEVAYAKCRDKGLGIVAQEFIAESRGRDLRVIAIHGKIEVVLGRQGPEGSFLSNVSQGGKYFEYTLSDDERRLVESVIKQFPADIAGFDFLFSKKGLLFCEINLAPGWPVQALPSIAALIQSKVK